MTSETHLRDAYHHGNLPEALIREGAKLLAEKGVEGFSMRQVARRAGVTVAAPAHHFGGAKGLLTAIATEGFGRLAKQLEEAAATASQPSEEVIAMCRAYVAMGLNDPGYALIMFRLDMLDVKNQLFLERSKDAFDMLGDALVRAARQDLEPAEVSHATKTLWAAMHGLVDLRMIEEDEADRLIRFAVTTLLAGLR